MADNIQGPIPTSGIANTLHTVIDIIAKAEPIVAAAPAFIDLLGVVISTFNSEDQQTVQSFYQEKMGKSDEAHAQVQQALADVQEPDGDAEGEEAQQKPDITG